MIVVGLSGGVDSAYTAYTLKKAGYPLHGIFMKNWEEDDTSDYCSAAEDAKDAQAVCRALEIPFSVINFAQDYWQNVFQHFLTEYQKGRTPNPDILCNQEIKFKVFLEHAQKMGASHIATGHYARILQGPQGPQLLRAKDNNKDQTYFLHTLTQDQLAHSLFPIGETLKTEVKDTIQQLGLSHWQRKESMGICFIGQRPFKAFLSEYLPAQKGEMVTTTGIGLGEHQGLLFYTLGQRQGLHIGGTKEGNGQPWYVVGKNLKENKLVVSQDPEDPHHFSQTVWVENPHWIAGTPTLPYPCTAKTRYRQNDEACTVYPDPESPHHLKVVFERPQRAVTPGQSLVWYQGEICLGGGVIHKTDSVGGLNL